MQPNEKLPHTPTKILSMLSSGYTPGHAANVLHDWFFEYIMLCVDRGAAPDDSICALYDQLRHLLLAVDQRRAKA